MKKDYMVRLERAARWRLPRQEAQDVISDYRDIVGDPPRPEEELLRDLGKPRDVIRPLVERKAYRTWLAAFGVMAACILALGISPTGPGFPIWIAFFHVWSDYPPGPILAVPGLFMALVWFRWRGQKIGSLPRAIPILLAALLAYICAILLFCWANTQDHEGFSAMWGTMKPLILIGPNNAVSKSMYLSKLAMIYTCPLLALVGVYGLVKARVGDRRWAAVYILALTAILAALLVLHLATSMNIPSAEEGARLMLIRASVATAIGLAGTGVALC